VPVALFFAFLLALPWALDTAAAKSPDAYYEMTLADAASRFGTTYYVFVAAAGIFLLWLIAMPRIDAAHKLAAAGALSTAISAIFVVPAAGAVQDPIKRAAEIAREGQYDVVMWGINVPSFSVYYGRPAAIRTPRPGDVVITRSRRLGELPAYDTVYTRNGVALVRIRG
jgi:hypothetical protein